MAKKREQWNVSWPWVAGGVLVAAVAVAGVMMMGSGGQVTNYREVVKDADLAAQYRGQQNMARSEADLHDRMAEYHAAQMDSATTLGGTVQAGAAMVQDKVQEGTASVRENYNGAMADYHNGQMQEGISATLPVTATLPQPQ